MKLTFSPTWRPERRLGLAEYLREEWSFAGHVCDMASDKPQWFEFLSLLLVPSWLIERVTLATCALRRHPMRCVGADWPGPHEEWKCDCGARHEQRG